jgi:hypothetical protein
VQLVAIRPRDGDHAPDRIDALCAASGLAPYEARSRVRVLDRWPGVLASVADLPRAIEMEARLRHAKFDAWTMPGMSGASVFVARRFSIVGDVLTVGSAAGDTLQIATASSRMLLAATDFRIDIDQVLEHEPGASTVGALAARAFLGLPNRASIARPVERKRERRERFVRLFAPGVPQVEFRASALQYAALDDIPVAPTRVENFARAMQRLRTAVAGVPWDDRLLTRSAQIRVLGPGLPPQRHLDLAIALLTRDVGGPANPYR